MTLSFGFACLVGLGVGSTGKDEDNELRASFSKELRGVVIRYGVSVGPEAGMEFGGRVSGDIGPSGMAGR
jgi:hypothetical protein